MEQKSKRVVKPKVVKKTLDLTIDDKEIDNIIENKNQSNNTIKDEKLQVFLNAFLNRH